MGDGRGSLQQISIGEQAASATRPPTVTQTLTGRTLTIGHGGQANRGWTIDHVEPGPNGRTRFVVLEEPGFTLNPETGAADYCQFPQAQAPGLHRFTVCRISRSRPR